MDIKPRATKTMIVKNNATVILVTRYWCSVRAMMVDESRERVKCRRTQKMVLIEYSVVGNLRFKLTTGKQAGGWSGKYTRTIDLNSFEPLVS